MAVDVPKAAVERDVGRTGVTERLMPDHASRAFRWAMRQSVVPSRWRIAKVVCVDGVEIRALIGVVEVMRWYRKGIPVRARRKGVSRRRLEIVLSGELEERPTSVPRRVCRGCEGERVTERRE